MKHIPKFFINELLSNTNIVDLIGNRIKVIQKGKYFYANCPFHNDKTPSFVINLDKQFYYCFGCNTHGNAIDFLINYDKLNFIESIEELSLQCGYKNIPYKKKYLKDKKNIYSKNILYNFMNNISNFYYKCLKNNDSHIALKYLNNRGITQEIIKDFSIGFAPFNSNNIINAFKNIDNKLLYITGILINNNGSIYDRFHGRIIFPIRDFRGNTVGFGGRSLSNNIKCKYINSPETEIFKKKRQLYGIYEAKKKNLKLDKIILVEGYMDVISLAKIGINYAVASLGTNISEEHIKYIYQFTDLVICCYDGDISGRKATWKILKHTLPFLTDYREMKFIFLPKNEDPDSLIKKIDKLKFEKIINKSKSLSEVFFKKLINKFNLNTYEEKAKLCRMAIFLINKIPGKFLSFFLKKQLCIKIGILDYENIEYILSKKIYYVNKIKLNIKNNIMKVLISILIQNPKISILVTNINYLKKVKLPGILLFIKIIKICNKYCNITTGQLIEFFRKTKYFNDIKILAIWDNMINKKNIEKIFNDYINILYKSIIEDRQEFLINYDRKIGLNKKQREELWSINKILSKK